jgi:flagellar hook assembly protein FlgD
LHQNTPNPFYDQTLIPFEIDSPAEISLEILNETGVQVRFITQKAYQNGKHTIPFDGTDLNPGIYFCILKSDGGVQLVKKMVILRRNNQY